MKAVTEKFVNDFFSRHNGLACIRSDIEQAASAWTAAFEHGGKLLLCGNGGSCADCDHIAGELLKGFLLKRPVSPELAERLTAMHGEDGAFLARSLQTGLPAISLAAHSAALSAFANDVDPALVYAQQVLAYGREGDVLVAISTSGSAENVNYAVKTAKTLGISTIGLTGRDGGKLKENCEICIVSPEKETYRIQEDHLAIYHLLCAVTELEAFAK